MFSPTPSSEFWSDLEEPVSLPITVNKNRVKEQLTLEDLGKFLVQNLPSVYEKDRISELLNRVRESYEIEMQNTLSSAERGLHKHYKRKIHELSEENLKLIQDLKDDYDQLKLLLTKKDFEIDNLRSKVAFQERFITSERIIKEDHTRPLPIIRDSKEEKLKKQLKSVEKQLENFKSVVELYLDETNKAKGELAVTEDRIQNIHDSYKEEIENIRKIHAEKEEDLLAQLKKLQDTHEKYRGDAGTELNVCHILEKKQTDLISTLQRELRSAKIVFRTPRLREKMRNKLESLDSVPKKRKKEIFLKKDIFKVKKTHDRGVSYDLSTRESKSPYTSGSVHK